MKMKGFSQTTVKESQGESSSGARRRSCAGKSLSRTLFYVSLFLTLPL